MPQLTRFARGAMVPDIEQPDAAVFYGGGLVLSRPDRPVARREKSRTSRSHGGPGRTATPGCEPRSSRREL